MNDFKIFIKIIKYRTHTCNISSLDSILVHGTFSPIILLLCTDSYTIKETVILMNILMIKYDISCTIRYYNNHYSRIYIYKK